MIVDTVDTVDTVDSTMNYCLKVIRKEPRYLGMLPLQYRDNKELVILAVQSDGFALEFASDRLKNDREVILAAVSNCRSQNGLFCASDELRDDEEIVLTAVSWSGDSLTWASDRLKDNKKIAWAAVKQNAGAFRYLSNRLKNDYDLVLSSVDNLNVGLFTEPIITDIPENLRNNREIAKLLVSKVGQWFHFLSDESKDDEEIVLTAVRQNSRAIDYASDRFKNDKNLALKVVRANFRTVGWMSEEVKSDKEVMNLVECGLQGKVLE